MCWAMPAQDVTALNIYVPGFRPQKHGPRPRCEALFPPTPLLPKLTSQAEQLFKESKTRVQRRFTSLTQNVDALK